MKKLDKTIYSTFKRGSKTYFTSSIFFPPLIRYDVFVLYGFVRKVDDIVDALPRKVEKYYAFRKSYEKALNGILSNDVIIDEFIQLIKRKNFKLEWIEAFLDSMEMDLTKSSYSTLDETLRYIYGSAEVIGLMMASIMELHEDSFNYAALLGRSMQYINFIRDIDEDVLLGRTYLPLDGVPFNTLKKAMTLKYRDAFIEFIKNQIDIYMMWQEEAEKGFVYIPQRYLIPIKTASDVYKWTAMKIKKDPFLVYKKKIKPIKSRIFFTIIKNNFKLKGVI